MDAWKSAIAVVGPGVVLAASMTPSAEASPLEARIGAAGLPPFVSLADAEFKWSSTPFRLGGSAFYVLDNYAQATGWGQYERQLTPTITIGGLAGLNIDWWRGATTMVPVGAAEDKSLDPGRIGYLFGVSYRQDWDRLWLKIAPSITLIPQDPLPPSPVRPALGYQYRPPEVNLWRSLFLGGPSWLEVGYRLTPSLELSLQTNWLSFLKVSWTL